MLIHNRVGSQAMGFPEKKRPELLIKSERNLNSCQLRECVTEIEHSSCSLDYFPELVSVSLRFMTAHCILPVYSDKQGQHMFIIVERKTFDDRYYQ